MAAEPCDPWLSPGVPNPECHRGIVDDVAEEARRLKRELEAAQMRRYLWLIALGYLAWRVLR